MKLGQARYEFIIDSYSNFFLKPSDFPTVRAYYLYKGLEQLGYSCFLRKRTGILERALSITKFTSGFRRYLKGPSLPPARFLILTYYQMADDHWETVKPEYEQADISHFFNLQDFSIGDDTAFCVNQSRWFREHGGNLCHTVSEIRQSKQEYFIGTGVDPRRFKAKKKPVILVECGIAANREKLDWRPPTISIEVINKALPQFQHRGYEVVACGDNLDDVPFSFKPEKTFRYSTHSKFARLLSEACVYVAANESYGLTLAEAQMAGTVLVLMKDQYNKQVVLTKLFSEYEGAKFDHDRFINIEESAESLTKAIESAINVTMEAGYHDQIRHSALREFDYREQAKKVADFCLAVGKSKDANRLR